MHVSGIFFEDLLQCGIGLLQVSLPQVVYGPIEALRNAARRPQIDRFSAAIRRETEGHHAYGERNCHQESNTHADHPQHSKRCHFESFQKKKGGARWTPPPYHELTC